MPTPSHINGIVDLTAASPSITGELSVTGFLVNSSNTSWTAKVTDAKGLTVFYATHSSTDRLPFGHHISPAIQLSDLDSSTSSDTNNILVYTGL